MLGHLCEMEGEVKVGEHLVPAHLDVSERAQFSQIVEERAVDSVCTNNLPVLPKHSRRQLLVEVTNICLEFSKTGNLSIISMFQPQDDQVM